MKALCWFGKHDVRVESVPDPVILNPQDCVVKITRTAICGSDLHLYDGYIPTMEQGDILGHEFMGEIVEVGPEVKKRKVGDRVVVPFTIACGNCFYCKQQLWSLCDNSNPNAQIAEALYGYSGSACSATRACMAATRVDRRSTRVFPSPTSDRSRVRAIWRRQVLLPQRHLSDSLHRRRNCDIEDGDIVAVWGCGPVGQFAIRSAKMLGAGKVIGIDRIPERLRLAQDGGAETVDYSQTPDLIETLKELTGGRGSDACIDAVGMEVHGHGVDWYSGRASR